MDEYAIECTPALLAAFARLLARDLHVDVAAAAGVAQKLERVWLEEYAQQFYMQLVGESSRWRAFRQQWSNRVNGGGVDAHVPRSWLHVVRRDG